MNLPNKITLFRVFLVPFFIVFMLCEGIPYGNYIAGAIFIIASLTDTLDGYLARKNNLVTDFGKFMDPLADKLLVCSALICFVAIDSIPMPAWIVIIIIGREFIISGFRLIAADHDVVIAANIWGKLKTVVQMVMSVLLIFRIDIYAVEVIEQVLIYASLVLTVISLFTYIWANRNLVLDSK